MAIIDRFRARAVTPEVVDPPTSTRFSLDDLAAQVNYLGNSYPLGLQTTMGNTPVEKVGRSYNSLAQLGMMGNSPVFALIHIRGHAFSEARFLWQRMSKGRPGDLFGTPALRLLEQPWPNGTTRELLWRAEMDVSLAGNFFVHRDGSRLRRMDPTKMSIVLGSLREPDDPAAQWDAEVIGYIYDPDGSGSTTSTFLPSEIGHWAPIPDPMAQFRGMSWLSAVTREITADTAATVHKNNYFDKAATPNMVVKVDPSTSYEKFLEFKEDFKGEYEGSHNAWKTLFIGGGSDLSVVGSSMKEIEFKATQGAGETRLAAAAGVPPILAGFSEGLASGTYSNYGQARRKFGDLWARPQWASFAGAIQHLLTPAPATRLWYDDREIPFLREDTSDEAQIRATDAQTLRTLIDAGWDPDAAVAFVATGQLAGLAGQHSGLFSVQLQAPGSGDVDQGEEG